MIQGNVFHHRLKQSAALLLLLAASASSAAAGVLRGVVADADSKTPLTGANVILVGTTRGAATDLDGGYAIFSVDPGTYTLKVTMLGYEPQVIDVIEIGEGTTAQDVLLASSAVKLDDITITAGAEKGSQERELEERLDKAAITDAVSKEVLKKLPDPDVANVVRRATGVSVDKGDPIIRGLGVRYSKVTLNNAAVAGTEPNRSAVSLELFPASLMSQVTISKSYLPDQNGEFAGGTVNMNTWSLPRGLEINASASTSINDQTTFRTFKTYAGGKLDWTGFDDGTRSLPAAVQNAERLVWGPPNSLGYSFDQLAKFGRDFQNVWSAQNATARPNQSYSLSIGNRTTLAGRPLNFVVTGMYGNSFNFRDIHRNVYKSGENRELVRMHSYNFRYYTRAVNLGSLAALKWAVSDRTNLNLNFLYSRDMTDQTRRYNGYNGDRQYNMKSTQLQFLAETTATTQLSGNHALPEVVHSTLDWQLTYSRGTRDEPDTRSIIYREEADGSYVYDNRTYSGSHIFNQMADNTFSGGLDWTLRPGGREFGPKVKLGAAASYRDRSSNYRRFEYIPSAGAEQNFTPEFLQQPGEVLFAPENIHTPGGWEISEFTRPTDSYTAKHTILAGYAMLETPVTARLFLTGGTRYEYSKQVVESFEPFAATETPASSDLTTGDVLPALSLRYELMSRMNLRFAASQTVSRPDFRELSEFEYTDFIGGFAVTGNPDLKRALIRNYDLRWEMVHGVSNLVAASVFYKQFINPIETALVPTAQISKTFVNADGANNYGVEFEVRQNLGILGGALRTLSVTSNLSLIRSRVQIDKSTGIQTSSDRALAGQSPYLFNLGFGYVNPVYNTQVSVFYNTFGKRISEVGFYGMPDTFEMPHKDLDVTASQPLGERLSLKLAAKNILDPDIRFEQGGKPTESYTIGRSFSIGLSYSN